MVTGAFTTPDLQAELYSRLDGIVSADFHHKRVFFGGLGAGSCGVEMIARCGPQRIIGADPDRVELSNISRTAYTSGDALLQRAKADALASRLRYVNPLVELDLRVADVTRLSSRELDDLLDVDLIVAGTDSVAAQQFLNAEALRRQVPAVFIGLHTQAAGGRVIWVVPGETGCYLCAAPERQQDHNGYELHAEPACIVDSLHVEVVAMRVVLGLLERGQPSVMGRFYDAMAGRNEVVVRCSPEYEWGASLWDAALADVPSETAAELRGLLCTSDTLWLQARRDPHCPACGAEKVT